jgi:4-diphosphocytidyl-2-C-methyl-D-erythritol kinase
MKRITLDAPCKINLSLDIVGRLENGYHQMDMVMQTVSLYDTLTLSLLPSEGAADIRMTCTLENAPEQTLACDESNIAVRCARAFFRESGASLNGQTLAIHLVKRIPMMAGLGGGSADGAAVIAGLNALLDAGLSLERLEQIGLSCGADIPFCLRGGTQRAQGIGEQFTPLPPMPDTPIVIVKPRFGISTRDAFSRCDTLPYPHAQPEQMIAALHRGSVPAVAGALQNVFEALCSAQESELLRQTRQLLLDAGALGALLSGSGSAVFGLFDREPDARRCVSALEGHPLLEGVFLCRPVTAGAFSQTNLQVIND